MKGSATQGAAASAPAGTAASAPAGAAASAPAGEAASAPADAAASGPEGKQPFATLVRDKFALWLLRELYKFRCFEVLGEFVKILEELVDAGCRSPGDLQALRSFAGTRVDDSSADMSVNIDAGSLESRLAFYNSVLYRDFVDTRARRMLSAAQRATTSADRRGCLKALAHVARETGRAEDCPLKREACWARTMMDTAIELPNRLAFALQRDSVERVRFAQKFNRLTDCDEGLHWGAVACLVDQEKVPAGVSEQDWDGALHLFLQFGWKEKIKNGEACNYVDFRSEVKGALDGPLVEDLLTAARRARVSSHDWDSAPEFDGSDFEEKTVLTVSKALVRLFNGAPKLPQWAADLKDRAAKIKSQARSAAEASKDSAAAAAAEAAPDSASATETSPTATATVATAAPQPSPDFWVGDTVSLDMTVAKKCQGANAVVKKVTPKELHVEAMTITGNMNKKVKKSQCTLVIPSPDRPKLAPAPTPAPTPPAPTPPAPTPPEPTPPAPTAAVAPVPSNAVAPAPTAAAGPALPAAPSLDTPTPTSAIAEEEECKKMAADMFNAFGED